MNECTLFQSVAYLSFFMLVLDVVACDLEHLYTSQLIMRCFCSEKIRGEWIFISIHRDREDGIFYFISVMYEPDQTTLHLSTEVEDHTKTTCLHIGKKRTTHIPQSLVGN